MKMTISNRQCEEDINSTGGKKKSGIVINEDDATQFHTSLSCYSGYSGVFLEQEHFLLCVLIYPVIETCRSVTEVIRFLQPSCVFLLCKVSI